MKRDDYMKYPIIDCHCHVYPDKIAQRAVESIGNFYDLAMFYDGKASTLVEYGSKAGVKHFVVFSVATTPSQVQSINNFIAETVKSSNGLMTGLGTLHPDSENIEGDIEQIKALGLKGVKMHPDFQKFEINSDKCDKIYALCEGVLPVYLHTGDSRYSFSNPDNMIPVLEKYPELTVIGAHFGGWSCWKEAAKKLSGYKNFYVDCSSSFDWFTPDEAAELVRMYGADKVLFGTDFPMWSHEKELKFFFSMKLTDEEQEKILYKNAIELFQIKI